MMCAKLARCVHDPNICLPLGEQFCFLFFDQCDVGNYIKNETYTYINTLKVLYF